MEATEPADSAEYRAPAGAPIILFANPKETQGIQTDLFLYAGNDVADRVIHAEEATDSPGGASDQDMLRYLQAGNRPAAILVSHPYRSVISKIKKLPEPMRNVPIVLYGFVDDLDGKVLKVPAANHNKDGELARVLKETLGDKL